MSKNEIMEVIELNKAAIKDAKAQIKQLKAHLAWCEEYARNFPGMKGVGGAFLYAIKFQEKRIEDSANFLNKRKKQMRLLEQLEALENE